MTELIRVKPTPQQLKEWDDTRAVLMWYAPALTHLFYKLMSKDADHIAVFVDDPRVPTAATDGNSVVINVNTFFQHSLMERLFILAHEILHNILNHIMLLHKLNRSKTVLLSNGKSLPFHPVAIQCALDYVVNAILVDSKIGKLPAEALYDLRIATAMDSVLDVYAKLFRDTGGRGKKPGDLPGQLGGSGQPPPPGENEEEEEGEEDNPGGAPGGFDVHLQPGTVDEIDPNQAESEHNQAEWDVHIKAAIEMAKSQGKMPAGLLRLFEEVIEDKVDWTDVVQSWFARKIGGGSWNWRKADRKLIVRDIWAPSRAGFGCDLIAIGVDTSGSIGHKEMSLWFGCLSNILAQLKPKRIIVIWCDAEVGQVDEIEDAMDLETIRRKGAPGGGGTDFRPVFDYIEDNRLGPEALVFLTDGYGEFPVRAPGYPTFWGTIGLQPEAYPFGEVVVVPHD